jgi:molybdopterin/thiamine biosynthesis adenylyltransferase
LDITRSNDVFNPTKFKDNVHVVGAGATGARVAISLIKMGLPPQQLHVYDFDKVERHNIGNQPYTNNDIGEYKVDALSKICADLEQKRIHTYNMRVNSAEHDPNTFDGVVFLLTDSFDSRRDIFRNIIQEGFDTKWVIETRMDVLHGIVYSIPMTIPKIVEKYDGTLDVKDEDVPASPCGTPLSIGSTADILSGYAIWSFIYCANFLYGTTRKEILPNDKLPEINKLQFSLRPHIILTSKYGA